MKKLQTFERNLENNFITDNTNKGENALIKDKFNKQITTLYDLIESATLTIHSGEEETPDLDINYVPGEDVSIGQFLIDNGIIKNLSKRNLNIHRYVHYSHKYLNLKKTTNVVDYLLHQNVLKSQNENDKHIEKANAVIDCINKDNSGAEFYIDTTSSTMTVQLTNINFNELIYTDADSRESEKLVNKGYEHSYYSNKDLIRFTLTLNLNIPVKSVKIGIKNQWSRWDKCFENFEILNLCSLDIKTRWVSGKGHLTSYKPMFNNCHVGVRHINNEDYREIGFKLFVERALIRSNHYHQQYLSDIRANALRAEREAREKRQEELATKTITESFSGEFRLYRDVSVSAITSFTEAGFNKADGTSMITCSTVTNELGQTILICDQEAMHGVIEVLGIINPKANRFVDQDVIKEMFNQTSDII